MSNIRKADLTYERFISAERAGRCITIECGMKSRTTDIFYIDPSNKFYKYLDLLLDKFSKITRSEIIYIGKSKAIKLIDLRRVDRVQYKGKKAIKITHKCGTMVLLKKARWFHFYDRILAENKYAINNPLDYKYLYWNVKNYL